MTKKQLLKIIRKETRPPAGFGQWIVVFEGRRLSEDLGLLRIEAYNDKRLELSGSLTTKLPAQKTFGPDGQELPPTVDWDKLKPGESTFATLTCEVRGKSLWEGLTDMVKRSVSEGKVQDAFPLLKKIGLGI